MCGRQAAASPSADRPPAKKLDAPRRANHQPPRPPPASARVALRPTAGFEPVDSWFVRGGFFHPVDRWLARHRAGRRGRKQRLAFPSRHRGAFVSAPAVDKDLLLAYDQNIVRHTQTISARRGELLRWKYFQYLGLLFTEIYLDRYFRDADQLMDDLNDHIAKFNLDKADRDQIKPFVADDLRKLAFWSATGSGKTLLMHVNICQYRHYQIG